MEFLPSLLTKNKNQRKLKEHVAINNGLEYAQSKGIRVICGYLWASVGHKICSAHILSSISIDGKDIDRYEGFPIDRYTFLFSTVSSREAD